jgi:hypothetical protein
MLRQKKAGPQLQRPIFIDKAKELHEFLSTLNTAQISKIMHVSDKLAMSVSAHIADWNTLKTNQSVAIDCFRGDIFSGLRASSLDSKDREYANQHLIFLSGLYGLIRPLDGIMPYRLEMGYKLEGFSTPSLYEYWGSLIADACKDKLILNLSSLEYAKVLTTYIPEENVYSPRFLTLDTASNTYKNVAVHAKIARGAFARWAIQYKINDPKKLVLFHDLGYSYDKKRSTEHTPVFTCDVFQGLGLSVRVQS